MKRNLLSIAILAVLMFASAIGYAQTTYTKVTSASGLEAGAKYLIVGYDENLGYCAMSYQKTNNRHAVSVTENGGSIATLVADNEGNQTDPYEFTLGGSDGAWTFFDPLKNGYLYAGSSSANHLKTQTTLDANGEWAIVFGEDGMAEVTAQGENTRNIMRFNENSSNGTPLFSCYNSGSSIIVPVIFYKAGGAADPDPEPSNYPTDFSAVADKNEVTLTWVDAVGEQLPSKYLVIGSTGSITVPTDGVAVPNGELVANVSYGVQTVTFGNLAGNTTYHFAIFPYTNGGMLIDYLTESGYPTVAVTTPDLHFLLNEDFDEELGVFTAYNAYGDQEWHHGSYQGTTYANMNGYANNLYNVNEDWLISPALNAANYSIVELEFRTAMKFDGDPLRVVVSTDYDGQSEPGEFTWEDITDAFDFSSGNYEWVESGVYNLAGMVSNHSFYLAFVYTSNSETASSWEIDYVTVIASGITSVSEGSRPVFNLYPNPANALVSFVLESDAKVGIFDMTGRQVSEMTLSAGEQSIQVANLENGVYFMDVRYADGKKEVARFVKF